MGCDRSLVFPAVFAFAVIALLLMTGNANQNAKNGQATIVQEMHRSAEVKGGPAQGPGLVWRRTFGQEHVAA